MKIETALSLMYEKTCAHSPIGSPFMEAFETIRAALGVVQKLSHNSDYAAALRVYHLFRSQTGLSSPNFDEWLGKQRLHSSTNVA